MNEKPYMTRQDLLYAVLLILGSWAAVGLPVLAVVKLFPR